MVGDHARLRAAARRVWREPDNHRRRRVGGGHQRTLADRLEPGFARGYREAHLAAAPQRRTPPPLGVGSVRRRRQPYHAVTNRPLALTAGGPMNGLRSSSQAKATLPSASVICIECVEDRGCSRAAARVIGPGPDRGSGDARTSRRQAAPLPQAFRAPRTGESRRVRPRSPPGLAADPRVAVQLEHDLVATADDQQHWCAHLRQPRTGQVWTAPARDHRPDLLTPVRRRPQRGAGAGAGAEVADRESASCGSCRAQRVAVTSRSASRSMSNTFVRSSSSSTVNRSTSSVASRRSFSARRPAGCGGCGGSSRCRARTRPGPVLTWAGPDRR